MKHIQGTLLTGYVTVSVEGELPELFFQACINESIPVWNIKKVSETVCEGNILSKDLKIVKQMQTDYEINVIDKKGYPFLFNKFIKKREMLFAFIISCIFVIFLSNIIWEIQIIGVSKEVEEKINDHLDKYGIYTGKWTLSLETPSAIQNKLINDIPELLWVGVQKKGTTFKLEGVEKTVIKEKVVHGPRNLVANKSGVITSMFIAKGLPKVQVNDYVKTGDLLVSGIINVKDEEETEENNKNVGEKVAAEGEVKANTWYNVSVSVPLKDNYEIITGNKKKKHYLQLGKLRLPIWGFGKVKYEDIHIEINENTIYIFKWESPFKLIETILSEKMYNEIERTEEEAVNLGITQARKELQLQLGPKIEIINEKVLHETIENGKVNLDLYFTVEENIVKVESITQGD